MLFCVPRAIGIRLFPTLSISADNIQLHEALAHVIPYLLFGHELRHFNIRSHCDNRATIAALTVLTGFSSNMRPLRPLSKLSRAPAPIASALSRICKQYDIRPRLGWRCGKHNIMADELSRCGCLVRRAALSNDLRYQLDEADRTMTRLSLYEMASQARSGEVET